MKRRRSREFDVFSMSFLDTICCAFGAIVLLYMILNASSGRANDHRTAAARAEADRLENQVLEGYENLVVLNNALAFGGYDAVMLFAREGTVNQAVRFTGLISEPLTILHTETAVIVALVPIRGTAFFMRI